MRRSKPSAAVLVAMIVGAVAYGHSQSQSSSSSSASVAVQLKQIAYLKASNPVEDHVTEQIVTFRAGDRKTIEIRARRLCSVFAEYNFWRVSISRRLGFAQDGCSNGPAATIPSRRSLPRGLCARGRPRLKPHDG